MRRPLPASLRAIEAGGRPLAAAARVMWHELFAVINVRACGRCRRPDAIIAALSVRMDDDGGCMDPIAAEDIALATCGPCAEDARCVRAVTGGWQLEIARSKGISA